MINFSTIVSTILEAEDNPLGARQGGLTGKSFSPKGFGASSAIRGIGLYNRERENRWEHNSDEVSRSQQQASAEIQQKQKEFYKKMSLIFSVINSDAALKSKTEDVIKDYMLYFNQVQSLRRRISRNINMGDTRKSIIPGQSDVIGNPDAPAGSSDVRVIDKGKPSQLAIDSQQSENLTEWLEDNEHAVYEHFIETVVDEVAETLYNRKLEALRARQEKSDEEIVDNKDVNYFKESIYTLLEKWYTIKMRSYQESKERYVHGGRNFYYGISTPVSSLASWLNSGAVQIGRERERAMRDVVTYNNSQRVVGAIEHIPEGKKIKRLLDIIDEAKHGFSLDAENTSRFHTPDVDLEADQKSSEKSFKQSVKFKDLKDEAYNILSDLDVILGAGQFELFKLLGSFFNEEPGAEGALVKFILNDVVASFNG